ncbi:hypothetical protein AB0E18_25290, partial [Streptomyces sp. NPDC047968]
MATLLIVHHTPSPNCQALLEAVVSGAGADGIEGVDVVRRPALAATAVDVLAADAYLLGTPANLGYMSVVDTSGACHGRFASVTDTTQNLFCPQMSVRTG